jgi:predicted nuclease of predicted toxin-antitoxin system
MQDAADDEILAWSGAESVVVTIDADFHALLAVSGAKGPSVIRLRIQGLRAPELASRVEKVLAEFETDLKRGVLITVRLHKTACHRLPIGGD